MIATKSSINIDLFLENCIEQRFPFALYKMPNSKQVKVIVSFDKSENRKRIDFDECGSGFVMAPYDKEKELPYFYKNDFEIDYQDFADIEMPEYLKDKFDLSKNILSENFSLKAKNDPCDSQSHKKKVEAVIACIQNGEAKKVVLSRKKHLGEITENKLYEGFQNLSKSNPSGFVSLVNVPYRLPALNQLSIKMEMKSGL
jgi:isochorismate synthase